MQFVFIFQFGGKSRYKGFKKTNYRTFVSILLQHPCDTAFTSQLQDLEPTDHVFFYRAEHYDCKLPCIALLLLSPIAANRVEKNRWGWLRLSTTYPSSWRYLRPPLQNRVLKSKPFIFYIPAIQQSKWNITWVHYFVIDSTHLSKGNFLFKSES